jgi:uncharacterized protein YprB with RNaseH-like and TPR domain
MENRLRKQLALIKSRAMHIARRGGVGTESESARPEGSSASRSPILDDLERAGAVTRASNLETRPPRGPWWWRRNPGRRPVDPVARAERASRFEAEFQSVFAGLAAGDAMPIETAVPGESRSIDGSNYYLVRLAGHDIDPAALAESERFAAFGAWPECVTRAMVGRFVRRGYAAPDTEPGLFSRNLADPRSILFLDIETAGLSANTYAFLCGLMYFDPATRTFHVEQAFARDYAEEQGLLMHVRAALSRFDTVVTYNGASFDMPFLRTRMAVHRIPDIVPMGSVDLLHATRRVFRPGLPNVRLVTVEEHLRGAGRVDDIPSRFIPRAYHEYVRTQDARIMRNVVYHNRMDLFTMAIILNHLTTMPLRVAVGEEIALASPLAGDTIASPNPPHVPF